MTSNRGDLRWESLSVGKKIACIPLFFILAIIVLPAYTIWTAQGMLSDADVADIIGRQRMLIQWHTKEVLLTSQGLSTSVGYKYPREILIKTNDALLTGGPVVAELLEETTFVVPKAPDEAIRTPLQDQKLLLQQLMNASDELLQLETTDPTYQAKLDELLDLEWKVHTSSREARAAYNNYIENKITTMITWEVIIGICVAVLGIVFSWIVSRGIVTPLASVVGMARNVAQGDLRGEKLVNPSNDEVGQMAAAFNTMLDSLRDLSGQIHAVTENVNSAAAEIMASTQQQASSTKEQAATVQQITTTMQEINQSGAQIVERAKQVATSAEAASAASKSGIQAVQDTNRTMEAIREQVEEVAENIVALSEKTQAVGEIVSTVNDIAEQSNLLALNATIEAAAAGNEGSRFSVVANEMKNLADRAKACTVQVRTILGEIQKGINSSVMLTEEAVKRVESGKQQAEVSEGTIREMTETSEDSIQAFQQIIGAANQQQIGFEQVTQGMQDIRQAAEQTAASTTQLEQAVANLTALSQQLRAAVGSYKI